MYPLGGRTSRAQLLRSSEPTKYVAQAIPSPSVMRAWTSRRPAPALCRVQDPRLPNQPPLFPPPLPVVLFFPTPYNSSKQQEDHGIPRLILTLFCLVVSFLTQLGLGFSPDQSFDSPCTTQISRLPCASCTESLDVLVSTSFFFFWEHVTSFSLLAQQVSTPFENENFLPATTIAAPTCHYLFLPLRSFGFGVSLLASSCLSSLSWFCVRLLPRVSHCAGLPPDLLLHFRVIIETLLASLWTLCSTFSSSGPDTICLSRKSSFPIRVAAKVPRTFHRVMYC